MARLKERRWELMEVGEEFGPLDLEVTDHLVKSFVYAVDDDFRYLCDRPDTSRIAPPTLLCREARDVIRTGYDITSGGAGMHTKHECEIFASPTIGQVVRITGRHVAKFVKREKQYIVLESWIHDEAGHPLLRQLSTHIRALRPGVARETPRAVNGPTGPTPLGTPVAEDATRLRPGDQLRPLTKRITQEQLTVFAGTEWPNIHNDPAVAAAAGLRGTVASGLQTMAYVSQLMTGYCGDGWSAGGRLAVAFIAPVFVNEVVYASGEVSRIDERDGRQRLVADVWCETGAGVRVLAGTAEGWLSA
ncbi:MaoC family dehydratase [Phytohabitans kaempferiae]|uniref:MaoC family dehydratase n=1 Tax=Phytohabitans kaempferiae TaxID=1620943 RepID=A0ABV6M9S3_9ACTN